MRVVVAGATGRIGSRTVAGLRDHGAEVVPVSRADGVDLGTGQGIDEALRGAAVVVDVTDAPSREAEVSRKFFAAATGNLLEAAAAAGVEHYVALSVVGADRVGSGYFRAKADQEGLATRSVVPYSLVRATPFFESVATAVEDGTRPSGVFVAPLAVRPVSLDDVAAAVAHVAVGVPLFGVLEAAGPEERRLDDFVTELLAADGRTDPVVADPGVPFFGAPVQEQSLFPGPDARLGHHTFAQWLKQR
ncbi:NAD(P)H-binding protein [Streptomyces sp. NPDC023723]|uniref:SDR family oxidoreductase n=1 Tax=Streptomyces sp. NPDC023723 TaxID=3154323 RepID=UPI0034039CE8